MLGLQLCQWLPASLQSVSSNIPVNGQKHVWFADTCGNSSRRFPAPTITAHVHIKLRTL